MTLSGRASKEAPMEVCETVEQAMASQKPFGDDFHILDQRRDCLIQRLEQLTPGMPAAGELLDAVAQSPSNDHRRLFAETTLRSAIGHAHKQLTADTPRGPRLLRLADCAAIFTTAARYVEHGGTDTPLQDGSLVRLGPKPQDGWIWRDEHPEDTYGRAFRELVMARYRMLPSTPDAGEFEMLTTGARLLNELLPSLAPSALHHAHVVACVPTSKAFFGSSSRPDLGGMFFLRQSLGSPWWIAEHLLHESIHLKLYDLLDGDTLMQSDGRYVERPVVTPWNPSRLSGANRWHAWRVLAAFHVYVHMTLLCTVAERRAPELEATYGPFSGMTESHRARDRARYLGRQLHTQARCWDELGPVGQKVADWLHSLLDILDPDPAPDGSTLHLYLDLYHGETDRLERTLAEQPTEHLGVLREELTGLARQDLASTRAVLRDLDANQQLARLDTADVGFTDAELGDSYPEIRRIVETCLLDASPDGYRMSESGAHDAMVGEMVDSASDALFALSARIPAPVAHAKRRAVEQRFTRSCDDSVGRLLAVQAAHLPPNARVLEIGTGVGIATAWIVSGLGSRNDVEILSVEVDDTLSATARTYHWPSYVRIETTDAETALADYPDTFDLILADASASTLDHVDAIVDAARSGGMLIFDHNAVSAAATEPDTSLTTLRQTVLDHNKLIAVDIDWASGLLVATKRP
jgi:predicted O-methyltransferase YrrM